MDKKNSAPQNIDEYIECFPLYSRKKLHLMRKTIKETAQKQAKKSAIRCQLFIYLGIWCIFPQ